MFFFVGVVKLKTIFDSYAETMLISTSYRLKVLKFLWFVVLRTLRDVSALYVFGGKILDFEAWLRARMSDVPSGRWQGGP